MVSFGGGTNDTKADNEVNTNKATNSFFFYVLHSLISVDYSNLWVKLKRGGDGWLTGINSLAHSLHFELSRKSHNISFFQLFGL